MQRGSRLIPDGMTFQRLAEIEARRRAVLDALDAGTARHRSEAYAFVLGDAAELIDTVRAALLNDHLAALNAQHEAERTHAREMAAFQASHPSRVPFLERVFGPLLTRRARVA